MRIPTLKILIVLLFLPLFLSCRRDPSRINTSSIDVQIDVRRLEMDLFTPGPDEIPAKLEELKSKYGSFLQLFSYVINTGDINDPSFADFLTRFCTDKQNNDVFSMTKEIYPDLSEFEKSIEEAFRHYLYYFPAKQVPSVYTCITGFNRSIIIGENILGVGLDRYLGADCKYYPQLEIYNYLAAKMTPDHIVADCIYGWGVSEWDRDELDYADENVLSVMIHEGKLKYFVKSMLPEIPDEIIFGFTPSQLKFCINNEGQMWLYLVENDLLFKTDYTIIKKLTGEAPFTSYFTNESPGKAAVWVGFRIVESFMRKNPSVRLAELMENVDIQQILEEAKYNPK